MTVDALLASARSEVLAVALEVLARGPEYAVLVSLDGDDLPVVDVLSMASIAVTLGLDCRAALAMVRRESAPLRAEEFRVVVIGCGDPVVVVMALESGEKARAA